MISDAAILVLLLWLIGFSALMTIKRSPHVLLGGVLAGWLFLPQFKLDLPGLDLNKLNLITACSGLSAFLIERRWLTGFKFSYLDLPAMAISVAPLLASMSVGLGVYDGCYAAVGAALIWTLPWFIGRAVFGSRENCLLLAQYTIVAALIYIPLCLYEMKMAPVLHVNVFGYPPRFAERSLTVDALRFGLWRPTVFMEFGLQLTLFMGISSLFALWATVIGPNKNDKRLVSRLAPFLLGITTVLSVSSGSILLTATGWALVWACRRRTLRVFLLILCFIPAIYPIFRMQMRIAAQFDSNSQNTELASRLNSLKTRVSNEEIFLAHWQKRPLLGWTASRYIEEGSDVIPDSLWIQVLCKYGLFGWLSMTAILVAPLWSVCQNNRTASLASHPEWILAIAVYIFMLDCLFNAMENPIYLLMAGAVVSVANTPARNHTDREPITGRPDINVRRVLWPR